MSKLGICIAATGLLLSCNHARTSRPDFIVFDSDPKEKDIPYRPTSAQIDKAEQRLFDYLQAKTAAGQTIYESVLDKKVPLQDQLRFYKRRYFGRISIDGVKKIKIEFVFVRCAGAERWKDIDYREDSNACWWSTQYDVEDDQIYDLRH